jgi:asparagine synthase (glutamine-hydrolysing)
LNPDFLAQQKKESLFQLVHWSGQQNLSYHLIDLIEEIILPHLLRYQDRNTMAHSVEARLPFLDYRLMQFTFNEAADWRLYQGWTKWILRQAMDQWGSKDIIWRKDKVGFATPEGDWMQQWLQTQSDPWRETALSQKYVNLNWARSKLKSWLKKDSDAQRVLRLINLEMWLRLWEQQEKNREK